METRDLRPNSESLVSQDEGDLPVNMNSHHVSSHTESPPAASGERLRDETKVIPAAPAAVKKYYGVMDDEGADDVFIPHLLRPPPCAVSPLSPAEESTGATASNSGVTPSNGAADATEAKANPSSLDRHHSEKQLMAARTERDEVKAGIVQTSKESLDNVLLSDEKDAAPTTCEDQTHVDETSRLREICQEETGIQCHDESNAKPEDTTILSEGRGNYGETHAEKDNYPKQIHSNYEDTSENETCLSEKVHKSKYEDIPGLNLRDSSMAENLDRESLETNAPPQPGLSANDDDSESSDSSELCKYNQIRMEEETNQPQVPDFSAGVTGDDEEHVDSRSLDYNLTRHDWVRRESGSADMQVAQVTGEEVEDRSRRISNDILQGEQLLQRLQLLQQRQDVHLPEDSQTTEQVVKETRGEGMGGIEVEDLTVRGRNSTDEEGKEEHRFHTVEKEKENLTEKEENEFKDIQTKVRMSSSSTLGQSEHQRKARTEISDSDEEERDRWIPADLSLNKPLEKASSEIEFLPSGHRFSTAETSIEKQMHEAVQPKQNLQRAGGVFNLTENPDVLEIPFRINVSLESLTNKDGASQSTDRQFSEQKMKKEISQEAQRELVLVNQGKIPGGYSKGEIRELKETKLLFEAFQLDNAEGLTRPSKLPTPVVKGPVYPSVLERTRSLEMLTLKSCPVSRAHSFRQYKSPTPEREKSPENFRSKSPIVPSRDKTRLSPYSKQDKHLRLHRSMDSISGNMSTLAVDVRGKVRDGKASKESPILQHNPFFKLRPALALQPEVEKDIREAKEREDELRQQRCTLYGLSTQQSEDEDKTWCTQTLMPDVRKLSRGKLERVWPPPSKKDQMKSEQTQEAKVHRAGGQKAALWQRWESGQINGQPSKEKPS
ncbi:uncharacterized protein LOC124997383 isoform X2 [Mugil cephalus]|uniref:uncharacterized protein LOC124997383 isoform X2 n=1 Tax=Mugil cephalus TaxID=48193 RepID=UPI001FB6D8B1|nr:uncharacterized protein LOC124997383 isoform X2 [Mugil cephalus]